MNATTYIPTDRLHAFVLGENLPVRTSGAALFADVSGFTPLTEGLTAVYGPQRGAEELTRQLNTIYDALIAAVDRYGGSVVVFSGDAITCWFDADDGRRAVASGLAMQEAMGAFAVISLPGGPTVELAVKVAIATGPVRRFLVGDPAIQFIDVIAGATLARMAAAEHLARRGEVVLDAAAAVHLHGCLALAEWRADEESGERVAVVAGLSETVTECPWPRLPAEPLPAPAIRPWLLPAIYERLADGQGEFLAELRPVVAFFLRFAAIDYDHDPDACATLDAYVRQVQHIVTAHGGALLQVIIGDKGSYLYAAFGAPLAHEDDPVRAVAAALALNPPADDGTAPAAVQIGIAQGRLWAGACGGAGRRSYSVMGDDVNVAARLMGLAAPGQILVGQRVAMAVAAHYDLESLGAVALKGKREPLPVTRVRGVRGPAPRSGIPPGVVGSLVGRAAEVTHLTDILAQVSAGRGQILRLEGPAGIGKSRLVAELLRLAEKRGLQTASGTCLSSAHDPAYLPWRQILRSLLGLEANASDEHAVAALEKVVAYRPEWALRMPLLGDLVGSPIPDNPTTAAFEPRLRRGALFDLIVEMVRAWAQERPLVLLIDDAHWMDAASQDLTLYLARAVAGAPVMVALVHRPPLLGQPLLTGLDTLPTHRRMVLDGLPSGAIAEIVNRRLGAEPTPLALDLVARETQGNPFFVEELVGAMREAHMLTFRSDGRWGLSEHLFGMLREAGCLVRVEGEWTLLPNAALSAADLGLPDSIHSVVLSRIDHLPETPKLTLKVASVIGHAFTREVLARTHPVQPAAIALAEQIDILCARDLIRLEDAHGDRYTFKHNVTQEVAYGTLLYTQRRRLHRSVADALEVVASEEIAPLAYHTFAAEEWPRAMHYHLLAGQRARALFANDQAVDHFRKTLHSAEHLPAVETAIPRQRAHEALGEILTSTDEYREALPHLHAARAEAGALGDHDAEAQACRWVARLYELRGDYQQALEWIQQGLGALNGRETCDAAEAFITAGLIYTRQGHYAEAAEQAERSLRMATDLGDQQAMGRAHGLLGMIERLRGQTMAALAHYQQALALYRQCGNVHGQGLVHNEIANAHFALGQWTAADDHYRRARGIFHSIGAVQFEIFAINNLGGIARDQGRLDDALAYYHDGLRSLERIEGSPYVLCAFHMNLGATYVRRGDAGAASRYLQRSEEYLAQAQSRDFLPELHRLHAQAALLAGRPAEAVREAERSLALARELEMRGDEGYALRVRGELAAAQGDLEGADRWLSESLAIVTTLGDDYGQAQCHHSLALVWLRQGRGAEAHGALHRAIAIFDALGAALDRDTAAHLLDATVASASEG